MIDEDALRAFLEALSDQLHWTSVVAVDASEGLNRNIPADIEQVNAGFDRLRRMLERAIVDEGEQHDEDPEPASP